MSAITNNPAIVGLIAGIVLLLCSIGLQVNFGGKVFQVDPPKWARIGVFVIGLVLALGSGGFMLFGGSAKTPPPPPPPSNRPSVAVPAVVVTAPLPNTSISGKAGVTLTGTATNIGQGTLWVFDPNGDTGDLYRDSSQALSVNGGTWSYHDQPIGDENNDDIGISYTIEIVLADPGCAAVISHTDPNHDYSQLPPGCTDAAHVTVVKGRA